MLDQSHKLRQVSNQILSSFSYLQVDVIIADHILSCICRRDVWSNHHIMPWQSHRQKYTMVGIQIDGYRLDPSRWCSRYPWGTHQLSLEIFIYLFHFRIQTKFNSIFLRRKSPCSGGHFLLLKNCKLHGRNGAMTAEMCFIKTRFQQDLKSWTSIISDLMRSRVSY